MIRIHQFLQLLPDAFKNILSTSCWRSISSPSNMYNLSSISFELQAEVIHLEEVKHSSSSPARIYSFYRGKNLESRFASVEKTFNVMDFQYRIFSSSSRPLPKLSSTSFHMMFVRIILSNSSPQSSSNRRKFFNGVPAMRLSDIRWK